MVKLWDTTFKFFIWVWVFNLEKLILINSECFWRWKIQLKFRYQHLLNRIGLKKVLLNKYFHNFKIKKVIDIGANIGQFATQIYSLGYKNEIHSFEPLKKEYSLLQSDFLLCRNDYLKEFN